MPYIQRKAFPPDTVSIHDLAFNALIDGTNRNFQLSTNLSTSFKHASESDELKYSINYAVLARDLGAFAKTNQARSFPSRENLVWHILRDVIFHIRPCNGATVSLSEQVGASSQFKTMLSRLKGPKDQVMKPQEDSDHIYINNILSQTVIGVFTQERLKKQPVIVNVNISIPLDPHHHIPGLDETLPVRVKSYVEGSNFKTVEALASNVCKVVLHDMPIEAKCTVQVTKPDAVENAGGVGVSVTESSEKNKAAIDFSGSDVSSEQFRLPDLSNKKDLSGLHIAYIAFGTNQGHQLDNIEAALGALEEKGIHILQTSSLYRSKPMYYLDQADFFNGCLKVETKLDPESLLAALKDIEYNRLKRVKKFNNGPRTIDLDIILYDDIVYDTPDLHIPHIRMLERSFVMLPLCELVPPDMLHPVTAEPLSDHLNQLMSGATTVPKSQQESSDLMTLVPIKKPNGDIKYMEYDSIHNKTKTQLMGILNVTPDSFSDGSEANLHVANCMKKVDDMVSSGVDIVDVGGCSTRPGSTQPSESEELSRVLPVVKAIKAKYGDQLLISVDTYRAKVAEETVKLGADIINDISAGMFDPKMYSVVAKYRVPYVINHTRGTIQTMTKLTDYSESVSPNMIVYNKRSNEDEVVVSEIAKELATLIGKMYESGIRRWQLILDPGLGFAKGLKVNVAVIRTLPYFKQFKRLNKITGEYISFDHMPLLLGPSRKKFIGTITGKNPARTRVEGTGACVASGIGFGSDIVRVHDYRQMKDICLMCDAIYKGVY